ncbi:50S ribosomal protein L25/general stress protein Ctc [Acidihalobacter ferrooxydans]|uniref:Large ribosomal subunit protein bL25 n=1 Tax=Acidihalobacter ferrooxydans TaxID=1765967 RepID=A0A1P8UGG8_9GAMM|nr:50S ribosomal protein L25/general stress protein Ctc [Acidihalobacter ferrooxydans]APZ42919.1 50S ribosomal protein L25/general stress protein Ctc [Acidihalobacter ferrooxydans]
MDTSFEVIAEKRDDQGKGASRRLRRAGRVPGIIYGGSGESAPISVLAHVLNKHLENEAFYSHILTVQLDGKRERVVLRDLQRHPSHPTILHFDLQRVSEDQAIHVRVPLHFLNEETAPGVKQSGGLVSRQLNEVEVSCLPKDLPEAIEVDLGALEMNESIHLSDLKLPAGVTLVELSYGEEHDQPVVAIHAPRVAAETDDEAEADEEEEAE